MWLANLGEGGTFGKEGLFYICFLFALNAIPECNRNSKTTNWPQSQQLTCQSPLLNFKFPWHVHRLKFRAVKRYANNSGYNRVVYQLARRGWPSSPTCRVNPAPSSKLGLVNHNHFSSKNAL
jgi:hypothetical protein